MYQILYQSQCLIPEEKLETEIRAILGAAGRNNKRDEITGLFLLVENKFLQLMEGEEDQVRKCFERISGDTRHNQVRLLMQRPVKERLFPKWSMHFSRMNGVEALEKVGASKLSDLKISSWEEGFKNDLGIMLLESFARLGAL
jgi:hypothetical protein